MPATALAVARNPELFSTGRGKLHWEESVSKAEQRRLITAGDPARLWPLICYMRENKEELQKEAFGDEGASMTASPRVG